MTAGPERSKCSFCRFPTGIHHLPGIFYIVSLYQVKREWWGVKKLLRVIYQLKGTLFRDGDGE